MKAPEYRDLPPHVKKFYCKLNRIRPGLGKKWLTEVIARRLDTLTSLYNYWSKYPNNLSIKGMPGHFVFDDTADGQDYWYDLIDIWKESD